MLFGWDINEDYVRQATNQIAAQHQSKQVKLMTQDFFLHDWDAEIARHAGNLLLLGNPPWVTNSGLSAIAGANLPAKTNFQGLRGIAAQTGKSNFDISEWMLLRLVQALHGRTASMAFLCKTSTARKFLRHAWKTNLPLQHASLYGIDAKLNFGASVDSCLIYLKTGDPATQAAKLYHSLDAPEAVRSIGMIRGELVADLAAFRSSQHLEGLCPYRWRSGVKHDCSAVMELQPGRRGYYLNQLGETVALEPTYLFPLLKSTDLARGRTPGKRVLLVTQRSTGDSTTPIAHTAPNTWDYLQRHRSQFASRKSSIYRSRDPFCLFGIGAYAFLDWKIAVSGLHKDIHFRLFGPEDGRPVFFDDTCYYLSFQSEDEAVLVHQVLTSAPCRKLLSALVFLDSKRPITAELLHRLNLTAMAAEAGLGEQWKRWRLMPPSGDQVQQFEMVMEDRISSVSVQITASHPSRRDRKFPTAQTRRSIKQGMVRLVKTSKTVAAGPKSS